MNKLSLSVLCAAMLTCGSALAQTHDDMPPPPPEHNEKQMEAHHEKMENKLADKLNLSQEQRSQAKEMRQTARKKIKPLMEDMKKIREQIDAIRKENMQAFEKLLTPEQKKQFDEIKAERKAHRPHDKHRGFHPLPPMPME